MKIVAVRICRSCGNPRKPALPFNLAVRIPTMNKTTRGAGATELCQDCWRSLIEGFPRQGGSVPA